MATLAGTAANDQLFGTAERDSIIGLAGHDLLDGGDGNDTIDGGAGFFDRLYGGAGGDYFAGFRDDDGVLTQVNYPLTNRHLGSMATLAMNNIANNLDVTLGVHGYRFWRRNWEAISPELETPYYDDRTMKDEVSGFAKAEYRVGGFTLAADVQVRGVTMTFLPDLSWLEPGTQIPVQDWFFVNPRFGVTYQLSREAHLFASAGHTGREPTRFDLLGGTMVNEANVDVLLNPGTVKAESVTDVELGYRHHAAQWSVEANGFAMFMTNEIAPIGQYIDQWFVQLRKNVPKSQRLGLEFVGSVQPIPQLGITAQATWMTSNIDSYTPENTGVDTTYVNVEAVLTPNVIATVAVDYAPVEPLTITGTVRTVGKQWLELSNNPQLTLDAFTVVDLGVTWKAFGRHRLGITVHNLFNETYAATGATTFWEGATVPAVFMQASRNVMVLLEVTL